MDNSNEEDQLPDAAERMEHEAYGEAGEENLQSDTAVELAGMAAEKDQAKEVKWKSTTILLFCAGGSSKNVESTGLSRLFFDTILSLSLSLNNLLQVRI